VCIASDSRPSTVALGSLLALVGPGTIGPRPSAKKNKKSLPPLPRSETESQKREEHDRQSDDGEISVGLCGEEAKHFYGNPIFQGSTSVASKRTSNVRRFFFAMEAQAGR
jgi:hypothetical protein